MHLHPSEDVNSIAHGFTLRSSLEHIILPAIEEIRAHLDALAKEHASTPMLARTHGQPASPTTFGKEMRVFEARIARQLEQLKATSILVKFAGATGNYNAHVAAAPKVDWPAFAKKFINSLNDGHAVPIELNEVTTQIEPHDTYAELLQSSPHQHYSHRFLGRYVALHNDGWVTQKPKEERWGLRQCRTR